MTSEVCCSPGLYLKSDFPLSAAWTIYTSIATTAITISAGSPRTKMMLTIAFMILSTSFTTFFTVFVKTFLTAFAVIFSLVLLTLLATLLAATFAVFFIPCLATFCAPFAMTFPAADAAFPAAAAVRFPCSIVLRVLFIVAFAFLPVRRAVLRSPTAPRTGPSTRDRPCAVWLDDAYCFDFPCAFPAAAPSAPVAFPEITLVMFFAFFAVFSPSFRAKMARIMLSSVLESPIFEFSIFLIFSSSSFLVFGTDSLLFSSRSLRDAAKPPTSSFPLFFESKKPFRITSSFAFSCAFRYFSAAFFWSPRNSPLSSFSFSFR